MVFKDWFFRQFPDYHQDTDVNKNLDGEGTFQRYLQTFGLELDEEMMPYIINFMNLIDIKLTDDKYLPLVATILGSPPSWDARPDHYRILLAYAVAIYKVKGTKRAFRILLGLIGLNVMFQIDNPPIKITYDMDPEVYYDDDHVYDSKCEYCSEFKILWSRKVIPEGEESPYAEMTDEQIHDIIFNISPWLTPINAQLGGIEKMVLVEDTYEYETNDLDQSEIGGSP